MQIPDFRKRQFTLAVTAVKELILNLESDGISFGEAKKLVITEMLKELGEEV